MTFSTLGLGSELIQAISDVGYTSPTPIQKAAIPMVLMGRDVLGCAQTGTGKTASFVLPMIEILSSGRSKARMPRSLILEPTRELAAQVADNFEQYGKYHKLTKALLTGGSSVFDQIKDIEKGADVLIATPGRFIDVFDRGHLLMTDVQILVIDEADRMLDMGFIPDVEKIVSILSPMRTTLFFSATMAPEIERITKEFLQAPELIEISKQASASKTIHQIVAIFKPRIKQDSSREKRSVLRSFLEKDMQEIKNGIIFCNKKRDVDLLKGSLVKYGFDANAIHGDLDQKNRTSILKSFSEEKLKFLVASDVAARGLDIPSVSHVFNFDIPLHPEDYVHRIGRTGRAGRKGTAITICLFSELKLLEKIELLIGTKINRVNLKSASPQSIELTNPSIKEKTSGKKVKSVQNQEHGTYKNSTSKNETKDENIDRVIGMGDHIPPFLLTPFPQ